MQLSNRTIAAAGAAAGVAATIFAAALGSYLTDYFGRAQPAAFVTAVGFGPPLGEQSVEVSESVVALSIKVDFLPSLKRFEPYRKLIEYDVKISEIQQELNKALSGLETWQKLYGASSLTRGAVEEHPLVKEDLFGKALLRAMDVEEQTAPPIPTADLKADLKKKKPLFENGQTKDGNKIQYVLWESNSSTAISVPSVAPDRKKNLVEQFILTLADGNTKNLEFFAEQAARRSQNDLNQLTILQDALRKIVQPASALTAKLYFYNNGQRATTIRPYFGLKVIHQFFKDKIFILAANNADGEPNANPFELASKGSTIHGPMEEEGKDVVVPRFSSPGSASQYINLPPNHAQEVDVSGIRQLGTDTSSLKEILHSGLLNFKILALTVDGKELWSAEASFSDKVGDDEEKDITKRTSGR